MDRQDRCGENEHPTRLDECNDKESEESDLVNDILDDNEMSSSSSSSSYSGCRILLKMAVYFLIFSLISAFILSIVALMNYPNGGDSTVNDGGYTVVGNPFSSLVTSETDGGLTVRVDGSESCDSDYCDDINSISCDEKYALRTFHIPDGSELFCICDGHSWDCGIKGEFCGTNPILPRGAQFVSDKGCINTPSSETCGFTCSESLIPSGEFTCIDGQWDTQYCACQSSTLQSELESNVIFGVSDIASCELTKSGETCDSWLCEGDLKRAHYATVKCGDDGWEISDDDALCVCQVNSLYTALAAKGVDYIDATNCEGTSAGGSCDPRDWQCPYGLHQQQEEFECSKKDGSWKVPDYPICVCGDTSDSILGFESGCGYLAVGQSCGHSSWRCEDELKPISPLECTVDGLKGQCGCSAVSLESSLPPSSQNALIEDCDKTPINEECTLWSCDKDLKKECCRSPVCNDDGTWGVEEDMCTGCDPSLLTKYGLNAVGDCAESFVGVGRDCMIDCKGSEAAAASPPFECPGGMADCLTTCGANLEWEIPCVCNSDTLANKVHFAEFVDPNAPMECKIGEKCQGIICQSEFLELGGVVICNDWRGFVGNCLCKPLSADVYNTSVGDLYEPGACGHFGLSEICEEDFCKADLVPIGEPIFCTGTEGWVLDVSQLSVETQPLCGCDTSNLCDDVGINDCISNQSSVVPPGNCSASLCPVTCDGDLDYSGGVIICQVNGTMACESGDICACENGP